MILTKVKKFKGEEVLKFVGLCHLRQIQNFVTSSFLEKKSKRHKAL